MIPRCPSRVYWWDCDLTTRCVRPETHGGPHSDRLRQWDDNGLQVDGAHATAVAALRAAS